MEGIHQTLVFTAVRDRQCSTEILKRGPLNYHMHVSECTFSEGFSHQGNTFQSLSPTLYGLCSWRLHTQKFEDLLLCLAKIMTKNGLVQDGVFSLSCAIMLHNTDMLK